MSKGLKITLIVMIAICLLMCIASQFIDRIIVLFRKKKNLEQYLGVAMARIVNIDLDIDSPEIVEMGLGENPDVIESWVNEIFEVFDVDGNGYLDLDEVNFFVGEVFRTAGIKIFYNNLDVTDLFAKQDDNDDGTVTKDEMKSFLLRLGSLPLVYPELLKIDKYRTADYYGDLIQRY